MYKEYISELIQCKMEIFGRLKPPSPYELTPKVTPFWLKTKTFIPYSKYILNKCNATCKVTFKKYCHDLF